MHQELATFHQTIRRNDLSWLSSRIPDVELLLYSDRVQTFWHILTSNQKHQLDAARKRLAIAIARKFP